VKILEPPPKPFYLVVREAVPGDPKRLVIGDKVRWRKGSHMHKFAGDVAGVIVAQPIGSFGSPPPGGVYVLWAALREPMACFDSDLESTKPDRGVEPSTRKAPTSTRKTPPATRKKSRKSLLDRVAVAMVGVPAKKARK
jgi:hypothetical protein